MIFSPRTLRLALPRFVGFLLCLVWWRFLLVSCSKEFVDEVGAVDASEFGNNLLAFFGFIPEEEHALAQLVGR